MKRKPRGKLLKVKFGVNPNSSSIGTDVIYMMLGTAMFFILSFGITGFVRMRRRNRSTGHVES